MAEMVLPGVYVEVRPEGLIVPGRVGVNTVGIAGTAGKGPLDTPVVLGSYTEAVERFGPYDRWVDGSSDELTLTRALELVFMHGATTVIAVRVGGKDVDGNSTASQATVTLNDDAAAAVATLEAKSPGTWGNDLRVNVWDAEEAPFVEDEEHSGAPANLTHSPVLKSARNRIEQFVGATGFTRNLEILYDGDPAPAGSQVQIDRATGALTFGTAPDGADKIVASYSVDAVSGRKVTIRQMRGAEVAAEETYTVVGGTDLVTTVNDDLAPSTLVTAGAGGGGLPAKSESAAAFLPLTGGANGSEAGAGDYKAGLDLLMNEDAHIMVAAGQDASFADELDAHCQNASTDAIKHDRIGVIGSGLGAAGSLDAVRGHAIASDRILFVSPGIQVNDSAGPGQPLVNLPGSYAAAAIAGRLAFYPAHVSLTNKTLAVSGLTEVYTPPQLAQLLKARVLPLERRQGFRIVRGITTSTNTAWLQVTTRRIVDYAKYGVRSAAEPYIGLLNNSRVRGAMRSTINSFLAEMVEDEMLVSYELDVTATRDDERKGVAKVTIVLRPVFSIDFVKVTMFLE